MRVDTVQSEIEKKLQKAKEGIPLLQAIASPFGFAERPLVREEVIARYQQGLDLFEEVRRTRAAHEAAVEAQKIAMPGLKRFPAQAMVVAQHHFGADPKRMATFGELSRIKPKQRVPRCQGNVVEEVVTTMVEEITTVSAQVPCKSKAPSCEEQPPKRKCRAARVPSRDPKPGCG